MRVVVRSIPDCLGRSLNPLVPGGLNPLVPGGLNPLLDEKITTRDRGSEPPSGRGLNPLVTSRK